MNTHLLLAFLQTADQMETETVGYEKEGMGVEGVRREFLGEKERDCQALIMNGGSLETVFRH